MIDYEVALARLLDGVSPLGAEIVEVGQAMGRIVARDVASPESLPPFDNSAMDGFALRCDAAALSAGSCFEVAGERAAGDGAVSAGEGAWEIMTGARMPEGLDSIVPVEQVEAVERDVDGRATRIRLLADVQPFQHLRRAGEDVRAGEPVIPQGTLVGPAKRMVCAALGIARLPVRRAPRAAILNTGRELVDDPEAALSAGEIRNSNGPFLDDRLRAAGADIVGRETIADDIDVFLAALARCDAAGVDLIVSTGAVSMGRYDFIPEALARVGADVLFHKARIRPGKPILAARLASGALFVGLPGNPASTAVGLRFFVEPVVRAMLGLAPEQAWRLPLASDYAKRVPLRMHLKARVALDETGRAVVHVLGGQESFRIKPLLHANAWAVVPAAVDRLEAGEPVEVFSRGHLDALELAR